MRRLTLPLLAASIFALNSCSSSTETKSTDTAASTTAAATDSASTSAATSATAATTSTSDASATAGAGSTTAATASAAPKADPNGPTAPHSTDAEFMMSAAHSDQNEIQQSKMALAKGVTGMAKDMANRMIADHTKSTAELKVIAAKKGVKLPADMDAEHKAMAPAMEKLSGKEFETKYMSQMVTDHQKTANTMAAHQKMTKDTDLQGFITKTLPVVESHLAMASQGSSMKM
jgi:putative membrane protein